MPVTSNPVAKATLLLTASAMAFAIAGCNIPIAVLPVPSFASSKELILVDTQRNRIERDGLLLVSRSQSMDLFLFHLPCAPSNHVVRIRGGRARIPHEWMPASVWLVSNEHVLFVGLGSIVSEPPRAMMILPLAAIPIPAIVPREESVFVIPLVPGNHNLGTGVDIRNERTIGKYHREGDIVLFPNSKSPTHAHSYWDKVRQRLRRRFEPTASKIGPDLRLNHYHYPRVKAFIDRELRRIDSIESHATPTTRAAPQRRNSAAPERDLRP